MNEFTTAILLATLLSAAPQDSTWEEKAVFRVQQTPASRYDPLLPSRPFAYWLNQVIGPQAGVSWRLGECVEQDGGASEGEQGIPVCVEATAILPDDRKVVAQILVGSIKQGLSVSTTFHFAVIESDSQFQSVRKLSDLPQLLREPFRIRQGPDVVSLPQIRFAGAPQLYGRGASAFLSPPRIARVETVDEVPPPPKLNATSRVSKGVVLGEPLTRVTPSYPLIARQINATGEVRVAVTIDERGRVIEAKAIMGHPALRTAAEDAARRWLFSPTLLDGKPVKQKGELTFKFTLPQ